MPLNLNLIKESFSSSSSKEAIYQTIMEWGKQLCAFPLEWKTEEYLVSGCQSMMYLHADLDEEGKIYFVAASDALISAGLAAILLEAYNGQTPETVLKTAPTFLDELGIPASLTPGRANGLSSLFLKMKQEALKCILPAYSTSTSAGQTTD